MNPTQAVKRGDKSIWEAL